MARPPSKDPAQAMTVTVPVSVIKRIVYLAEREHMSKSSMAAKIIRAGLGEGKVYRGTGR